MLYDERPHGVHPAVPVENIEDFGFARGDMYGPHQGKVIAELEQTRTTVANEITATERAAASLWERLLVPSHDPFA